MISPAKYAAGNKIPALLVFLAGGCNALAFAPTGWWPLQLLCLSLLFYILAHTAGTKKVMLFSWLYASSWLFFGVIWLSVTMYRYGDMPVWLSFVALALFAASLALIPALFMGFAARVRHHFSATAVALVLFPACWSLAEWVRGWLFTGFPWLVSGYAHTASPLAGYAPLIGVYGIGWLVAVLAGCVLAWRRTPALLAVAVFLLGSGLQLIHWTSPHGAPLSVRLLQGNVDQKIKFQQEHLVDSLQFYYHAIRAKPADLIITPESALPLTMDSLPESYLANLQAFSNETNSYVALGLFGYDGKDRYANSLIGLTPASAAREAASYRYDKHHLVPFGEFMPWGFAWFYHYMQIPMGDLERGALIAPPFTVRDQQVLPTICYEDVFGEEIAARLANRFFMQKAVPGILLNVTNLAWFGDSWALPQHLQIAQMRTLETGRPMLRATNTGTTALINAQGQVEQRLASYTRGELDVMVQAYQGITPYIVCGNWLWLGLMLLFTVITGISSYRASVKN